MLHKRHDIIPIPGARDPDALQRTYELARLGLAEGASLAQLDIAQHGTPAEWVILEVANASSATHSGSRRSGQ